MAGVWQVPDSSLFLKQRGKEGQVPSFSEGRQQQQDEGLEDMHVPPSAGGSGSEVALHSTRMWALGRADSLRIGGHPTSEQMCPSPRQKGTGVAPLPVIAATPL